MGRNAALMCQAVAKATGYVAEIGMDLDVEGAVSMPHIGDFVNAYRKQAPYGSPFPLMMWYVLCVVCRQLRRVCGGCGRGERSAGIG